MNEKFAYSEMSHQTPSNRSRFKKYRRQETRNDEDYHHKKHQEKQQANISVHRAEKNHHQDLSSGRKISLEHFHKTASILRNQFKKFDVVSDDTNMETLTLQEHKGSKSDGSEFDICNHGNGGGSGGSGGEFLGINCWDEMDKAVGMDDASMVPSAAYIEQDVISKQRREMSLLMEELSIRDQELHDLVRSHQAQVKAWETDRNKLRELQQRVVKYEKELHKSDQDLKATLDEMRCMTTQKEIDSQELKKTKGEMEGLSKRIQENSFYLKELEVQNKNLLDSVKKLMTSKEELEAKLKELNTRYKSKTAELTCQSLEVEKLTDHGKALDSQLGEAKEGIRNFKTETAAWKNRYCLSRDESDRLTEENKRKDDHIQTLTVQLHETLQQTLALQKALFTSCEREKCKDEVMNSLRKQQKRTMQEMSSLRKLYEMQSKDLTLYHLDVRNDTTAANLEQQDQSVVMKGDGEGEQTFVVSSRNNKNMSYNKNKKPNFLNFQSRASTFLVKKKLTSPDLTQNDTPDDKNCNERFDVSSDYHNGDESEMGSEFRGYESSPCEARMECVQNSNQRTAPTKHQDKEHESDRVKRRSLSTSDAERLMNKQQQQHQHHSYSRPQSPIPIRHDIGTSPFQDLQLKNNKSSWISGDMHKVIQLVDHCSNACKGACHQEGNVLKKVNQSLNSKPSSVKQQMHNETSGVYLSSSDISCSTISSPDRGKVYDELTPADSDGMCQELKREFIPNQHDSPASFQKRLPKTKSLSIHLRNSPTQSSNQDGPFIQAASNNDNGVCGKVDPYTSKTYFLVEEPKNQDAPGDKKQRCTTEYVKRGRNENTREEKNCSCRKQQCGRDVNDNSIAKMGQTPQIRSRNSIVTQQNNSSNRNENKVFLDNSDNVDSPCSSLGVESHACQSQRFHTVTSNPGLSSQHQQYKDDKKILNRERTFTATKETDRGIQNQCHSNSVERRSGQNMKNVRIASPECDFTQYDKTEIPSNVWKRNTMYPVSHTSDTVTLDSEKSELSLSSSHRPSHCSFRENLAKDSVQSLNSRLGSQSKSSSTYLQQIKNNGKLSNNNYETALKNVESVMSFSCNANREYFYDENLTSDSDRGSLRRNVDLGQCSENGNAYVVPVSVSHRPFTSTKAPSLFKKLSSIHYSEKSRRYELGNPSQQREEYVNHLHHQSVPSTSMAAGNHHDINTNHNCNGDDDVENDDNVSNHDANSNSDSFKSDVLMEKIDLNFNNSCNIDIVDLGEDRTTFRYEYSSPSIHHVDSLLIKDNSSTTNMDKFNHHYINIVKKLHFSNQTDDHDDEYLESSLFMYKDKTPGEQIEKKIETRTDNIQGLEFYKTSSDDTYLSHSQIEVSVSNSENNNIVRKLNFSDSTCIEQSGLSIDNRSQSSSFPTFDDLKSSCSNYLVNKASNNQNIYVPNPDNTSQKQKIHHPLEHDHHKYVPYYKGSGDEYLIINDRVTDLDNKVLIADVYDGSNKGGKEFSTSQGQSGREFDKQFIISLPDYFPDISSVTVDNSVSTEEEVPVLDFINDSYEFVSKHDSKEQDVNDNQNKIDCNILSQLDPYGRTSTPTPKPEVEMIDTNVLDNSSQDEKCADGKTIVESNEFENVLLFKLDNDNRVKSDILYRKEIQNVENKNENKSKTIYEINSRNTMDCGISQHMNGKGDLKMESKSLLNHGFTQPVSSQEYTRSYSQLSSQVSLSKHSNFNDDDVTLSTSENSNCFSSGKLEAVMKVFDENKPDFKQEEEKQDKFEQRLSSYLMDSSIDESTISLSMSNVPMSPASKLHYLLVESQKMICNLEKISSSK